VEGKQKQMEAACDAQDKPLPLSALLRLEPPLTLNMIAVLRDYLKMSWGQFAGALEYHSRQYPWGVARGQFPITGAFEKRFWALVEANPPPNTFQPQRFDRLIPERRCLGRRMVCRECLAELMEQHGTSVWLDLSRVREHCLWIAGRQRHYCSTEHRKRFYHRPKGLRERIIALAAELEAVL